MRLPEDDVGNVTNVLFISDAFSNVRWKRHQVFQVGGKLLEKLDTPNRIKILPPNNRIDDHRRGARRYQLTETRG